MTFLKYLNSKSAYFILNLFLSIILFLFTKFIIGNYYEVYECIPPTAISGKLMDGNPGNIIYPIASILLSDFYVILYSYLPNIPWYDYMMASYLIIACAIIFSAIHLYLTTEKNFTTWKVILINCILFFLFIADNILNWNYTRTSFIVCISAFIWHTFSLLRHRQLIKNVYSTLTVLILFSLGTLIRPEVGQLICILIIIWSLFYKGLIKNFSLMILPYFFPVLLISGIIYFDRLTTDEFYIQLNPFTEYQIAHGNVVDICEIRTPEDSMKYIALRQGVLNDPENITIDFMNEIVDKNPISFLNCSMVKRAIEILKNLASYYWHVVTLVLLLAITCTFHFWSIKHGGGRFLFFTMLYWAVVFSISCLMTMEARIFQPLLFLYLSCALLFLLKHRSFVINKFIIKILVMSIPVFLSANLIQLMKTKNEYKYRILINRLRYEQLKEAANNKILVSDGAGSMILLSDNFLPFQNVDFSSFRKIFMIDMEAITLAPAYQYYLNKNCNCNPKSLGELFDYFYKNKKELILVGSPKRIKLFQDYLKVIYQKNYGFKSKGKIMTVDQMNDYTLDENFDVQIFTID